MDFTATTKTPVCFFFLFFCFSAVSDFHLRTAFERLLWGELKYQIFLHQAECLQKRFFSVRPTLPQNSVVVFFFFYDALIRITNPMCTRLSQRIILVLLGLFRSSPPQICLSVSLCTAWCSVQLHIYSPALEGCRRAWNYSIKLNISWTVAIKIHCAVLSSYPKRFILSVQVMKEIKENSILISPGFEFTWVFKLGLWSSVKLFFFFSFMRLKHQSLLCESKE